MDCQNFRDWFATPLEKLYDNGNAGFAIMMIAFPLLERYLREKSGSCEDPGLNDDAYKEFRIVFPEITDDKMARGFWQAYRHGILHQGAVSLKNRKGVVLPSGWLSNDFDTIVVDPAGNFCVHPAKFAKRIVQTIENAFEAFQGKRSAAHPLPTVFDIGSTYCGTAAPSAEFDWPGTSGKKRA